jgi:hypothetical protein
MQGGSIYSKPGGSITRNRAPDGSPVSPSRIEHDGGRPPSHAIEIQSNPLGGYQLTRARVDLVTRSSGGKALYPEKQANRDCGSQHFHCDLYPHLWMLRKTVAIGNYCANQQRLYSPRSACGLNTGPEDQAKQRLGKRIRTGVINGRFVLGILVVRTSTNGRQLPNSVNFRCRPTAVGRR